MGSASFKQNVVIQISYCGGCGWVPTAKTVCDKILQRLPGVTIDCRPQNIYTGVLEATLIIDKKQRRKVYKGDKDTTLKNVDKIINDVVNAYNLT